MKNKIIIVLIILFILTFFYINSLIYGQNIQITSNNQNSSTNQNLNYCNFSRVLQYGSKGKDVACLQKFLKSQGFFKGKINGIYNKLTKESVRKWQKANNIKPSDGIFNIPSISFYVKSNINKFTDQSSQSLIQQLNNDYGILNTKEIDAAKILIDNQKGIDGLLNYMQYVFINTSSVTTSPSSGITSSIPQITSSTSGISAFNQQIANIFKDEPFSLEFMIDKMMEKQQITTNISNEKLNLFETFFKQRLQMLQNTAINERLEKLHKGLIINDLASLKLLKYFKDFLNTQITLEQFKTYYNLYKETITKSQKEYLPSVNAVHELLSPKYSIKNNQTPLSFLKNIFQKFIAQNALAEISFFKPFGGRIASPPILCPCSGGRLVVIGPPKPIILFVYFGFEATPLMYKYKQLFTPGVYTLGLAFPVVIPCLSHEYCIPIGAGFLIYMAGTGLVPASM
ncbi:MAG: hypothetical protein KatS3mg097_583 [Candidatus Parcubacteria bacterium]|nr:MAG: hypothetical protein KatS3mg097_583 [Candidatus Parcubacteria bacterium]